MNRREWMTRILGGSVAASIAPVATTADAGSALVIDPGSVRANSVEVTQGKGDQFSFSLTLLKKPWPLVGQVISIQFEKFHLVGRVTSIRTEPLRTSDRVYYHIEGETLEFDAQAVLDR